MASPAKAHAREQTRGRTWDEISDHRQPSWYLDPLVAEQKRTVHVELCRRWSPARVARALKTDLFEEAFGEDALLPELSGAAETWFAMDVSGSTVRRSRFRLRGRSVQFVAADVRALSLRPATLDLVISTSTLDHFVSRQEFVAAIREIARVLRPGGVLIITLDNSLNPLYWPLRWLSQTRWVPFPIGYTPSPARLDRLLEDAGFEVTAHATLIHNPRLASTVWFLALRRLLRSRADRPIRGVLAAFEVLERLPTRRLTACFLGARAVRLETTPHDPSLTGVVET
jgi:SAM-dependent methyltransferase